MESRPRVGYGDPVNLVNLKALKAAMDRLWHQCEVESRYGNGDDIRRAQERFNQAEKAYKDAKAAQGQGST